MKKIVSAIVAITMLIACNNNSTNSPKAVATSFIEASKSGDVNQIKKYITNQDAALLDYAENVLAMVDSSQKERMKQKLGSEFKEKMSNVKIDLSNEKEMGDSASVDVSITKDGKTQTRPFILKKEQGTWKVSLLSTGIKETGMSVEQMQAKLKEMENRFKNFSTVKDSVIEGLDKIKNMSNDSLNKLINSGVEKLEKLNDVSKKNNK